MNSIMTIELLGDVLKGKYSIEKVQVVEKKTKTRKKMVTIKTTKKQLLQENKDLQKQIKEDADVKKAYLQRIREITKYNPIIITLMIISFLVSVGLLLVLLKVV